MNEQEYLYIKKPKISEAGKTSYFVDYLKSPKKYDSILELTSENRYDYWDDKFKYRIPEITKIKDKEDAWNIIRLLRGLKSNAIPIKTESDEYFKWYRQKKTDKILMEFDKAVGGNTLSSSSDKINKEKYIISGIMEEAISSSKLEGANTTRQYAKRMIAEKIKPKNASERMILNHHRVLTAVDESLKNKKMSKELLLEIQSELTKGTLEDEGHLGRFRTDKDNIIVQYKQKIVHTPPKEAFLMEQIDEFVKYANDDSDFIHPLVKASILHFWIGYLHPFCDGNGRTARTIFYWYLLRKGYWGVYFLPISSTLLKARVQYTYSYIYAEQDGLDFTYFFDFISRKIIETIKSFNEYVNKKSNELSKQSKQYRDLKLNDRQIQAVTRLKNGTEYVTAKSQSQLNKIGYATARKDLYDLEDKGLVYSEKQGVEVRYFMKEE